MSDMILGTVEFKLALILVRLVTELQVLLVHSMALLSAIVLGGQYSIIPKLLGSP